MSREAFQTGSRLTSKTETLVNLTQPNRQSDLRPTLQVLIWGWCLGTVRTLVGKPSLTGSRLTSKTETLVNLT